MCDFQLQLMLGEIIYFLSSLCSAVTVDTLTEYFDMCKHLCMAQKSSLHQISCVHNVKEVKLIAVERLQHGYLKDSFTMF